MIGIICRDYRLSKNVPLTYLANGTNYKTLYSFESGQSTNYKHLAPYLRLADQYGDADAFIADLLTIFKEG